MTITLTADLFTNNVYTVAYGLKKAVFTIVDETYESSGVTIVVNGMICRIQTFDADGNKLSEVFGSLVIGLGDSGVAVTSADTTLLGKKLTSDNMSDCSVELYE